MEDQKDKKQCTWREAGILVVCYWGAFLTAGPLVVFLLEKANLA